MSPRLLLVEDSASDEKLTLLALRASGVEHRVVVARDGAEALERLAEPGAEYALVLLDLRMPRIDGFDVLRRVRADPETSLVPVVVLTASREDEDVRRALALGANAYVQKPMDYDEFTETMASIARFWLVASARPGSP